MHKKEQCKGKCVMHKQHDVEGWLLERFHFKDNTEYIIFLVWALFVSAFLVTIIK